MPVSFASSRPCSVTHGSGERSCACEIMPKQNAAALAVARKKKRRRQRAIDPKLVAELIRLYTPLVLKIAGGFLRKLPRNVLREDLVAAGMGGLWDAVRRHPDGPGDAFEWYVRTRVRGAIIDELRAQDWLPRRARAAASAASGTDAYIPPPAIVRFDDISASEENRSLVAASQAADADVMAHETRDRLVAAIATLPERDQHIVSRHYFGGVKFRDLGDELGVSEPRISQLNTRAIKRLRETLRREKST